MATDINRLLFYNFFSFSLLIVVGGYVNYSASLSNLYWFYASLLVTGLITMRLLGGQKSGRLVALQIRLDNKRFVTGSIFSNCE